jgi:hypothetical protein
MTYGLVATINAVARELWAAHAAAIKQRCAAEMPKGLISLQEAARLRLQSSASLRDTAGGVPRFLLRGR